MHFQKEQRITSAPTKSTDTHDAVKSFLATPATRWFSNKWLYGLASAIVFLVLLLMASVFIAESQQQDAQDASSGEGGFMAIGGVAVQGGSCALVGPCTIQCANIVEGSPGDIAVEFIAEQTECKEDDIQGLTFKDSIFPNSALNVNWLPLKQKIQILEIWDCDINLIEDGAFSNLAFRAPDKTARLTLAGLNVRQLTQGTFEGITGLHLLEIRKLEYLEYVVDGILTPIEDMLTSFQFSETTPANAQMISNFTNRGNLNAVEIADFQHNPSLSGLTGGMFGGLKYIRSLYFKRSNLKDITADAFQSIARTIQQIDLSSNKLTTLPNGTLDGLPITSNDKYSFKIYLGNNPWHCNCSLLWLQDMMFQYPEMVADTPYCDTPHNEPPITLQDAEMCAGQSTRPPPTTTASTTDVPEVTTEISPFTTENPSTEITVTTTEYPSTEITVTTTEYPSTEIPETTTTIPNINYNYTVDCEDVASKMVTTRNLKIIEAYEYEQMLKHPTRKLLSSVAFTKVDFTVEEIGDSGDVMVNVGSLTVTLVWMTDYTETPPSCRSGATGEIRVADLQKDATYTFCLLIGEDQEASPFNCKALTTLPLHAQQKWLAYEDMRWVVPLCILLPILCCVICAKIVFALVRHNPEYIKDSKRVVFVKHRAADVMVLPKGVDKESLSSTSSIYRKQSSAGASMQPSYARISEVSGRSSNTSYISAVEPTQSQLVQWRMEQMRARLKRKIFGEDGDTNGPRLSNSSLGSPPPLPPYPRILSGIEDDASSMSSTSYESTL